MTKRQYGLGIAILIGIHCLILVAFATNTIPLQSRHPHEPYWFHHGGDNYGYAEQAFAIAEGNYQPNKYPLGFPILMLPAVFLIPEPSHDTLLQPISLFWSGVMFPLAVVMLGAFAQKLTRSRFIALAASAVFVALPLLYLLIFNLLWNQEMAEIIAIHSTWAHMLTDGPTAFFSLAASLLYMHSREKQHPWYWVLLLGAFLGFLGMIRFTGLLLAFVIGGLFLLDRQWKMAIVLVLGAGIGFAPQAAYNMVFFDSPLTTGYTVLDELPPEGLFSPVYVVQAIETTYEKLGVLSIAIASIGLAFTGFVFWRLWKLHAHGSLLVIGWVLSYVVFYSVYYYSWTGAMMRFMIPVYPAAALLAVVWFARPSKSSSEH